MEIIYALVPLLGGWLEYGLIASLFLKRASSRDYLLLISSGLVGGYGYIATWRKNLFAFNTKLLSKRCGLFDENGNLLKAARVPKN